jgi:hypothetical protein
MKLRLSVLLAAGIMSAAMARAEDKPISDAASNALQAMGKSLSTQGFSFRDHTIREYTDQDGQPLHIVHNGSILVRRPDHLLVDVVGDDGTNKLDYDGKTVTIYDHDANKYVSVPVTGPLENMLKETSERLGVDFPLADFLTPTPDKAFLTGVTFGTEVNTVTIDGEPCRHLFFMQPPGIELELWVEKNDRAFPRRLVVTYRSLPGEPRFIAEMSDWKVGLNPPDSDFAFTPPNGATKIEPKGIAQ